VIPTIRHSGKKQNYGDSKKIMVTEMVWGGRGVQVEHRILRAVKTLMYNGAYLSVYICQTPWNMHH
jgi:hypothetical protein